MISITVNGNKINTTKGTSVLEACLSNNIEIPNLCYDKRLSIDGSCRLCLVEVEGVRGLTTSCNLIAKDGMVVYTESEKIIEARRDILTLLVADHPHDCMTCEKSGICKLQDYCYKYNVCDTYFGDKNLKHFDNQIDDSNPFFTLDRSKCILCNKCVRVCKELQGVSALSISNRGHKAQIATPFLENINDTYCVSCGNCVSVCPTDALMPKKPEKFRYWDVKRTRTTCSYCGVGCQIELLTKDNKVVEINPINATANNGLLCVKGKFGYKFLDHPARLKKPLIRKGTELVEATWQEAFEFIKQKAESIKEETGSYSFASLASARCTNEENYLMQKLTRAVFKTNDIDHCARLCHSSTVSGLGTTFGSAAMTNSINGILNSDVIFIIGSNTTETHPVIATYMKQAKMRGAKIIVADPRKIEIAKDADIYMQIKPGSNIALINAMIKVIHDENLYNQTFINERTENFDSLVDAINNIDLDEYCNICGVDKELVKKAATMYAKANKAGIYYAMGITQFSSGTNAVMSVSNLALMCGHLGKDGSGVNPLRGQNNVQGACDMGGLPTDFPGYQKVLSSDTIKKFEEAWNTTLSPKVGKTLTEIIDGSLTKDIRFLYIMGENPIVSDPDTKHIKKALESFDLLVVQDIFLTETAEYADVVLPAAAFAEKDGTFTNTERRVQLVRKAINPPGEAKTDWEILNHMFNLFGYSSNYNSAEDIFNEIRKVTPSYAGITYKKIEDLDGVCWPCPTMDHPGTPILHTEKFARGKGLFVPIYYTKPAETTDNEYPLYMTTGRNLYQYHTRTMTGKVKGLKKDSAYIEISPITAEKYNISDGEQIRVYSKRGFLEAPVCFVNTIQDDLIFVPFHYANAPANMLTSSEHNFLDPSSKIPELKLTKVRIEKQKS